MAKTYLMGDGKMTEEDRLNLQKHYEELEARDRKWAQEQKEREKAKKEVTLAELLATEIRPQEDRIVVWRDKAKTVTEGGIIKPNEVLQNERPAKGTVIAVGPGKSNENLTQELLLAILIATDVDLNYVETAERLESRINTSTSNYKPGDRIMFGRFAGTPIDDPKTGEELLVMRPHDIFVKL